MLRRHRIAGLRTMLRLIAMLTVGCCGCEIGRTQVLLCLHSDMLEAPAGPLQRVLIAIRSPGMDGGSWGGPTLSFVGPTPATTLRRSRYITTIYAANNDSSEEFEVEARVETLPPTDSFVVRAIARFVPHETRQLCLELSDACRGRPPCAATQTCESGRCVDIRRPTTAFAGALDGGFVRDAR